MNSNEIVDDPFTKMIETFSMLENENRALCLISTFIGEKTDSNTIKGILDIFVKLKGENVTPGKLRGYLTPLISGGLIERESEKIIGSTKVSFHQITTLGVLGVIYLCFMKSNNPNELDWDREIIKSVQHNEEKFIYTLAEIFILSFKSTAKILTLVSKGSTLSKLKINPFSMSVIIHFGKEKTFKVFEELLYNYLQSQPNFSRNKLELLLGGEKMGKYVRRLDGLLLEEKLGKTTYYSLGTKGLFLLPILILFIRELSIDKSLLEPLNVVSVAVDEDKNEGLRFDFWSILTKRSIILFKKLFSIEQIF